MTAMTSNYFVYALLYDSEISTQSNGASSVTREIHKKIFDVFQNFSKTTSYFPIDKIERELDSIYSECGIKDWDGYGAEPLNKDLKTIVLQFIKTKINGKYTLPELAPDGKGCLNLEWKNDAYHILLTIDKDSRAHYAVLTKQDSFFGDFEIKNEIPLALRSILQEICQS